MISKILEKEMVPHTRNATIRNSSNNQFGFKKDLSCINAGILLTEALMEAKDSKKPIYLCLMDTTKAFDMVDHPNLLCSLYQQGVKNQLWHLYNSAYNDIKSVVKWQGQLSETFEEKQGIRQGGLTSADAFICKADPLLKKITEHPDSFCIGHISLCAVI